MISPKSAFLVLFSICAITSIDAQIKKLPLKKQEQLKQVKDKVKPKDNADKDKPENTTTDTTNGKQKKMLGSGAELLEESGAILNTDENSIIAIRELLMLASNKSISKLGAANGFLLDSTVKIQLPSDASKITGTLKKMGMGKMVDDAIVSINKAAESAVSASKEELTAAIKNLNASNVTEIITNKDTAATKYMRSQCMVSLTARIRPIVDASLKKSNATKYWSDIFSNYNKISKSKINPDLTDYVNSKVLDAIFLKMGIEEMSIRRNPGDGAGKVLRAILGNR